MIENGSVWVNGTGKIIATVIGVVEQEVCFSVYDSEHGYRQSRSCNIAVFKDSYRRLDLLVQKFNEYEEQPTSVDKQEMKLMDWVDLGAGR